MLHDDVGAGFYVTLERDFDRNAEILMVAHFKLVDVAARAVRILSALVNRNRNVAFAGLEHQGVDVDGDSAERDGGGILADLSRLRLYNVSDYRRIFSVFTAEPASITKT